jgi:tetratricopeptide (TPR) repeat protein/predicted aspartyl protease
MRMNTRLLLGLAAMLLSAGWWDAAAAACQLSKYADVPVVMRGLRPTIAAQVNGKDTNFLVDTGAFFSTISTEAKDRFGLRKSMVPFGMQVKGLGGSARDAEAARADVLTVAGMGFKNIDFLVGGRVGGDDIAGLLGENIMGAFDVEYDLANGVIRFFKAQGCSDANLAYWSKGMAVSRLSIDSVGPYTLRVVASAYINGHLIHAQLDTGSAVSYLGQHSAERMGIQVSTQGVENGGVAYGLFGKGIETYLAPFASFKIGDEEIKNTRLRVANIELGDQAEMLLGADFFLSHRIFVSNSQKKLYFTYNGGPVFRLENRSVAAPATQTAQAGSTPAAGPASVPAAGPDAGKATAAPAGAPALASASEYARRAAASAARRDLAAALADYAKAIELDPEAGANYRARALIRLDMRQPVLAMADLDQALKRQPQDIPALMLRAELFLQSHDVKHAQADFDAALKLAPPDGELPASVGIAYARGGEYDLAVRHLDAWIATHPKSENLGQALAGRCWARALSGASLDQALADCDQALKRDRNSQTMSYRGLVLFRMGRLDEAIGQYGQALKAQPRLAPALYGRGLAELKKGATAQGQADIAAATAIAPGLPQDYRRYGLAPDSAPQGAPDAKAGG